MSAFLEARVEQLKAECERLRANRDDVVLAFESQVRENAALTERLRIAEDRIARVEALQAKAPYGLFTCGNSGDYEQGIADYAKLLRAAIAGEGNAMNTDPEPRDGGCDVNTPRFDRVEIAQIGDAGDAFDVVTHRRADGTIFAWHSPLERGPVRCSLCETPGSRVYVGAAT